MKTEITLDKQALAALLKDPKIKIRLHDAVIEGVTKKVVDETSEEIKKKVLEHVDDMVMAVIRSDCKQMFYPRPGSSALVELTCNVKDKIKQEVNTAFMQQTSQMVYDRLNNLEDKLRKRVDESWGLLMNEKRVENVITYHIKELIENGLKKALNVDVEE